MKKTWMLASALLASALLAVPAGADELPYARTLPQYIYYNATLMTPETYLNPHLNPQYSYYFFSGRNDEDKYFLTFSAPEGAQAESFGTNKADYIDVDKTIVYSYYVNESDSYEEFINKAEADEYILQDGMDGSGTAAYIDPESCRAYGMIATKQFGKSSKLRITLQLGYLDRKMPLEERVSALSDAITAEVARVAAEMTYESAEPYWSRDKFAGVKLLDPYFERLYTLQFPVLTMNYNDGSQNEQNMIITNLDGTSVNGIYDFGQGQYIETDISFDSYTYVTYAIEEGKENAGPETLDNGSEWLVYLSYIRDDGGVSSWYAAKPLGVKDHSDKEVYMTINMSANNMTFGDKSGVLEVLALYDGLVSVADPYEDVYVPSETEAPVQAETEASAPDEQAQPAEWTCPNCQTVNSGNFCSECGTARPEESSSWDCPQCGQTGNEGKFCPNCGTPRPE